MVAWLAIDVALGACTPTALEPLLELPQTTVYVLGERRGTALDLARAARLVAILPEPVTVALQAVDRSHQPLLDDLAAGKVQAKDVPKLAAIEDTWGFPGRPYTPLLAAADRVIALGGGPARTPSDVAPQSPGRAHVLAAWAGPMPVAVEADVVNAVTWTEHELALRALTTWDGRGSLVLVVDRLHVEGGGGVDWQIERQSDRTPAPVLLSPAGSKCGAGEISWMWPGARAWHGMFSAQP